MKIIYKQAIRTLGLTLIGGVLGVLVAIPGLQLETQVILGATSILILIGASKQLYNMQPK